ncbi:predicted protein [Sclerotinia sclerotiorum 1980 UF-70]|uniref:Uncharacterized protein n=1 Tax=Sclerotinia sclerotiorum (strain ATCC 18683 / 1980 / Ss-1) TaxID=665079 RepID=A7EF08_SCLS1|nr:predicted protein [Sclerotinia sclerotiorum 1980 UF-70]EDO01424.1 predicted protein [Sclerotinia sclerotiorum 1980 UF-70]
MIIPAFDMGVCLLIWGGPYMFITEEKLQTEMVGFVYWK